MLKAGSELPPPADLTARLGTTEPRSMTLVIRLATSDCAVTAVIEIGTSCWFCSRFCAVTTISVTPLACASAVAAGDGVVWADAAVAISATVAQPQADKVLTEK